MKKFLISICIILLIIVSFVGFKKHKFNQLVEKKMADYVSTQIVDEKSIDTSSLSYNWFDNTYKYNISFSKSTDSFISVEYKVPEPIMKAVFDKTVKDFYPVVYTHFNGTSIEFDNKITETIFKEIPFKKSVFSNK
ncbi:DUF3139 domain-containing protein [Vagococcus sp. JNUCC 83]